MIVTVIWLGLIVMLREIAFHIDSNVHMPDAWQKHNLQRLTYRIAELFSFQLPRTFAPDGIAKLNINVQCEMDSRKYWKFERIGNIHIEANRFVPILALSPKECDASLLLLIQDLIKENLPLDSEESDQIDEAVVNVVNSDFGLKIRLPKLSKIHPTRKLSMAVNRSIDNSGETWTAEIWYNKYERFAKAFALIEDTHAYLASNEFASSKWDRNGRVFSLRNSQGKISRRINVSPFLKIAR